MTEHKDATTPGQVADMVATLRDGFGSDMAKPIQDYFTESAPQIMGKAADVIEAQSAELTALRAERAIDHAEINLKADFIAATIDQLAQMEFERDAFRAVLAAAGYQKLDEIAAYSVGDAALLGCMARLATSKIISERDAALARVGVLEVALREFADPKSWFESDPHDYGDPMIQCWGDGSIKPEDFARAALAHKGADE